MKRFVFIFSAIFLLLGVFPAWGDVTIESSFKTTGFKGAGGSEGETKSRLRENKKWTSSSSKFTGSILSRITSGTEDITITRLDKGVIWNLNAKNRSYSETPIEKLQIKESPAGKGESEKPKVRVTKSEFTVKKTGASEAINGFPCEEYLVTWLTEWEEIETKAKSTSTMTTNLWTTPETSTIRKAQAEELAFQKTYAQKIGLEVSSAEGDKMGMAAFAALSGAPQAEIEKGLMQLKNEMSKVKGYPIRTTVNWTMEGEKGQAAGQNEGAAKESAPQSPAGVGGQLFGKLKNLLPKKTDEKSSTPPGKEAPFFSSTIEVKSISAELVSPEVFEIPAGYAKK